MSHPDPELLADIALGESVDPPTGDHVLPCPRCSDEVRELRRAIDLTRRGLGESVDWQQPPVDLWSRIDAALQEDADTATTDTGTATAVTSVAAPTTALPDGDRQVPVPLAQARARRRASRSMTWLAAVAAAGAVVGLLTGRALWAGGSPPAQPAAVAEAGLKTLDTSQVVGAASVLREDGHLDLSLDLQTQSLPSVGSKGYLEVWLINRDGRRMVSVGVLDDPQSRAGATAVTVFPIAQSLLDAGYVVVDVSLEAFDDDARHSGDSLARGTLA